MKILLPESTFDDATFTEATVFDEQIIGCFPASSMGNSCQDWLLALEEGCTAKEMLKNPDE